MRPTAKPVQLPRGEIVLYLSGGYIIQGTRNFVIPVGVSVDIELISSSDGSVISKSDWFFNNDEVLEVVVREDGRRVCIKSVSVGDCVALVRSLGLEIKIEVSGGSAVGFESEVLSEVLE
jgi:hypothetical protein